MELVDIASAQPGHVTALPVTNPIGVVIYPSGFRLTRAAIDRLKHGGVESVTVKTSIGTRDRLQERMAQLEMRFKTITDPLLLQIKEMIEKRLHSMLIELDT